MPLTVPQLQTVVVQYATSGLKQVSDFVVGSGPNQVDLSLLALNNAVAQAQQEHDFKYEMTFCQVDVDLNVGTDLGTAVWVSDGVTPVSVKAIKGVFLSNKSGAQYPIEFIGKDNLAQRLFEQTGSYEVNFQDRYPADGDCRWNHRNRVCYQVGSTIFLYPGSVTTGEIQRVYLDVAQWLLPFTADMNPLNSNFMLLFASSWLQWQAVLELNKLTTQFVGFRQEGNVGEASIVRMRDEAWEKLMKWDEFMIESGREPMGY